MPSCGMNSKELRTSPRPIKVVPDAEAWVHEPAMQQQLRRAGEWAKRTPRAETKLDELEKSVAKRQGKRA